MERSSIFNARCTRGFIRGSLIVVVTLLAGARAAAELREMNTDRPDTTESPFTVDAGHWQLEMDLVSYTRNQVEGERTREWDITPLNLRFGLSPRLEMGLFISPYTRVVEKARDGTRVTSSGFGDVTVRTKFNFAGNDGGGPAYGLIADFKIPSASSGLGNGHVEGAVILPFAIDLPGGWDFGAMTKVEVRHRENGGSRGVLINSATVGHGLCRDVSAYVELTSATGEGSHVATADFGITWKTDANTQLDIGANVGISKAADDLQVFTGLSRRF